MKRILAKAALAALTALTGCAAPQGSALPSKKIDRTFAIAKGTTTDGIEIALAGFVGKSAGNSIIICAAASAEGASTFLSDWPPAILQRAQFLIGEDVVHRGAPFGARYFDTSVLIGKAANCVDTGSPWQAAYEKKGIAVRFGRIVLST